jgi:hypothetical protein
MIKHSGWKVGIGVVTIALACPWSVRAEQAHARAQAEIGAGTAVHAVLETKLDARTAKVGDDIKARASRPVKAGERVVLPRGSKLLGRISMVQTGAEADARSESKLGVSFERAVLPDGTELAVDLAIQAIAVAESEVEETPRVRSSRAMDTPMSERSGRRGGLLEAPGELLGDAPEIALGSDVQIDADARLGRSLNADGTLAASSEGVIGLRGLQLDATGKSSVIARANGPVTLSSGTRLLLRAKGAVSAH